MARYVTRRPQCPYCHTGHLVRRRVFRMPGVLVGFGFLLVLAGLGSAGMGGILLWAEMQAHTSTMGVWTASGVTLIVIGLGALLLGWLLASRKTMVVCNSCRVALPGR